MSDSTSKKLALVKRIINKGKYEDALQHVKDIEEDKNLTPKETLRIQAYKTRLYFYLGPFKIALKTAEELYQKSQEMKMPLFSLDALFAKFFPS